MDNRSNQLPPKVLESFSLSLTMFSLNLDQRPSALEAIRIRGPPCYKALRQNASFPTMTCNIVNYILSKESLTLDLTMINFHSSLGIRTISGHPHHLWASAPSLGIRTISGQLPYDLVDLDLTSYIMIWVETTLNHSLVLTKPSSS